MPRSTRAWVRGPRRAASKGLVLLAARLPPNGLSARPTLLLPTFPTMLRKTETRAIHLIRGLYDAAEGRPNQWHSLHDLDVPQAAESVRYATSRGWIRVERGNSLCLTDAGWRLTELL